MPIEPPESFGFNRAKQPSRHVVQTALPSTLGTNEKNLLTQGIEKQPNSVKVFAVATKAVVTKAALATDRQLQTLFKNFPTLLNNTPYTSTQANPQKENTLPNVYLAEISIKNSGSVDKKIIVTTTPLRIGEQLVIAAKNLRNNNSKIRSQVEPNHSFYKISATNKETIPSAVFESIRQALPKQTSIASIVQLASIITQDKDAQDILSHFQNTITPKSTANLLSEAPEKNSLANLKHNLQSGIESGIKKNDILKTLQQISQFSIDKHSASSDNIKQLIENNGIFLEQLLSSALKNNEGIRPETKDLKALLLILKPLLEKKNTTEVGSTKKQSRNDIVRQIHQLVLSTLAKIQLNQARSILENRSASHDNIHFGSHCFFEIPMKWEQGFSSLSIELWRESEDYKSKNKEQKEDSTQEQYWKVKLEFDLPHQKKFYAQIQAQKNSVNFIFWADTEQHKKVIAHETKELTEKLKKYGVTVESTKIQLGKPVDQKKPFNISLIDVKT
ncbi:MAG: hypothetical protein ACRBCS_03530 [Cellvibrionaceae bacterium]